MLLMPSADLLPEIVKRGHLPPAILPTFLHEFMHHWCFHSPVGQALAASFLEGRQFAVVSSSCGDLDHDSDDYWNAAHDLLRFRVANALLRPFSEGMALFAEHDLFVGEEALVSESGRTAYKLFCDSATRAKEFKDGSPFGGLKRLLIRERISQGAESRKIHLLSQPLRYSSRDTSSGVCGSASPK